MGELANAHNKNTMTALFTPLLTLGPDPVQVRRGVYLENDKTTEGDIAVSVPFSVSDPSLAPTWILELVAYGSFCANPFNAYRPHELHRPAFPANTNLCKQIRTFQPLPGDNQIVKAKQVSDPASESDEINAQYAKEISAVLKAGQDDCDVYDLVIDTTIPVTPSASTTQFCDTVAYMMSVQGVTITDVVAGLRAPTPVIPTQGQTLALWLAADQLTAMFNTTNGYIHTRESGYMVGLLNTQMAVASGIATFGVWEILTAGWFKLGEPTLEGATKGALIGLAATASGAAYIQPMWTVLIAATAVTLVYFFLWLFKNFTIPGLQVFFIHGFGGAVGVAMTGLFASQAFGAPENGSWLGNGITLGRQCAGISVILLMTGVFTPVLYYVTAFLGNWI